MWWAGEVKGPKEWGSSINSDPFGFGIQNNTRTNHVTSDFRGAEIDTFPKMLKGPKLPCVNSTRVMKVIFPIFKTQGLLLPFLKLEDRNCHLIKSFIQGPFVINCDFPRA